MKMRWLRFVGATTVALAAIVACAEEETTEAPAPAKPASADMESLASAVCDVAYRCCSSGELAFYLGPFMTQESCSERFAHVLEVSQSSGVGGEVRGSGLSVPGLAAINEAVRQGRVALKPGAVQACREYLESLPCNEPEPDPEPGCHPPEPPPELSPCHPRNLLEGKVGDGGECTSDPTGPGAYYYECREGLVCRHNDLLGTRGQCVKASGEGKICYYDDECVSGLYCSDLDGTCQPPKKEGEACAFSDRDNLSPTSQTLLVQCESHLSCNPITDTCVARCQAGAVCSNDAECDEKQELVCIMGRCGALRGIGIPCAEREDCVNGLRCAPDPLDPTRNVCQERLSIGEGCFSNSQCATDFCDSSTGACAPTVAPGAVCSSLDNAQCANGYCYFDTSRFCTGDPDCPGSSCNLFRNLCEPVCVATKQDSAQCLSDLECQSRTCVAGTCRTLPLSNGLQCEASDQCESEFCSLDADRVCKPLPLALGEICFTDEQCASKVCYQAEGSFDRSCAEGLPKGALCGGPMQPPCVPGRLYCDRDKDEPSCVPLLDVGDECEASFQCLGECAVAYGRWMCAPATPEDKAICDGAE